MSFTKHIVAALPSLAGAALFAQEPPAAAADPEPRWHLEPFRVEADGKPIAVPTGHAAPFVVDMDGDGVRDLVVGSFGSDAKGVGGGTCRIYRNEGTDAEPKFGSFTLLQSDGKPASMESS